MEETIKCLIIGSGPAGYTAAIYTSRANLQPVLYEGIEPGGQLTTTTDVENFPGYPDGVSGQQMMADMRRQAERFGTEIRTGTATRVDLASRPFHVVIDGEKEIRAESLIIATGASARYLGLPSETKFRGMGVSACATCDGFFYRKKDVAVVGGGDTACEEATYLASICRKVYMIVRKPHLRASKAMQQRVFSTPNIEVIFNHNTAEVLGDESGVTGALLRCNDGKEVKIDISGFFLAIGHHPNTELFRDQLQLDAEGYIKVEPGTSITNIEGVFAAGDVRDPHYRQAVTAAASGCIAAIDCERFLLSRANLKRMSFSVTILGSSSAKPTLSRHPSAQVVNVHEQYYLVDAGEGVQQQLIRYGINPLRLRAVFISHLHGDHVFGLFPLISTLALYGRKTPLRVFAPAPMGEILACHLKYFDSELPYPVVWTEVDTTKHALLMENRTLEVWSIPLRHRVPTAGFLFREKEPALNVDKFKITKYGLSVAQITAAKRGEDVTLSTGEVIPNGELTYRPYAPRSYAYLSDTNFSAKAAALAAGADLMYHEATYAAAEQKAARERGHSTTTDAAKAALKAGAKRLVIGHYSSRYKDENMLVEEARAIFPETYPATEGMTFTLEKQR